MRLGIMQPYFYPYLGYFQLINAVDKFILYGNVSFRKKSWITRNYVLPNGGKMLQIFVPVLCKSSNKKIQEIKIEIGYWRTRLLDQIFFAYRNAAFFEETFELIKRNLYLSSENIYDFNSDLIIEISKYLDIPSVIVKDNSVFNMIEKELDFSCGIIEKEFFDKKTKRILQICKTEGCDSYYNPIGGETLYSKEDFIKNGIDLRFIKMDDLQYKQFDNSFTPNLSIIDVLMHCGKIKTKEFLKNYQLL